MMFIYVINVKLFGMKFKIPEDYKDLGWQLHPGNSEEIKKCSELKHQIRKIDNSMFTNRGTDIIYICDECKILWHIDMSD